MLIMFQELYWACNHYLIQFAQQPFVVLIHHKLLDTARKVIRPRSHFTKKWGQNSKLRSSQPLSCTVPYHIPTGVLKLPIDLIIVSAICKPVVKIWKIKTWSWWEYLHLQNQQGPQTRASSRRPESWFTSSEHSKIPAIIPLSLWFKIISPFKSLLKWGLDRVIGTFESKKKFAHGNEFQYSTSVFCYAEGFESTYFPFYNVHHSPSKAHWVRTTLYSSKPSKLQVTSGHKTYSIHYIYVSKTYY